MTTVNAHTTKVHKENKLSKTSPNVRLQMSSKQILQTSKQILVQNHLDMTDFKP